MDDFLQQKRINVYRNLAKLSESDWIDWIDSKNSTVNQCPLCKETLHRGEQLIKTFNICLGCYYFFCEFHWRCEYKIIHNKIN